jgi:hypothetical protein
MKPIKKDKKEEEERKGKKNQEPKKSIGSDGGLPNSQQDKHLERKKK